MYTNTHTTVWNNNNRGRMRVFVADIDFKKGITCKTTKTQEDAICLNKDSAKYTNDPEGYKNAFAYVLIAICKGSYHLNEKPIESSHTSNMAPCAFK